MRDLLRRSGRGRKARIVHRTHPEAERLDDRTVPSTFTVSSLADNGLGSLRQAILDANAKSGDDIINFGVTGTINLSGALPNLSTNIDVQGPGAGLLTVRRDTGGSYRILTVASGATATVSGLTISNGRPNDYANGAGILNAGTLTLNEVAVSGNETGGYGGGIYNAFGATLTVASSTISGNEGASGGGGIYNAGGTVTVTASTLGGNIAALPGGGIYNAGTATVTNSTLDGNQVWWVGSGGGIYNAFGATLTVASSTIASNFAADYGIPNYGGGGIYNAGTLRSRNTIVAGNSTESTPAPDLYGDLGSLGHNLIGDTSGGAGFVGTDLLNVDPLLGPLQDNGGPTWTRALLTGSPAIDAGDNSDAPPLDQRGLTRVAHGTIDIGAFELQTLTSTLATTTSMASSLNPSVYGQAVTFTATVSAADPGTGIPTGTVTFKDGATVLATRTLNGSGAATISTSALGVGSHTVTAAYSGDDHFSVSTGTLTQTVSAASLFGTTTTVVSSANPSVYGQAVTFTATVSAIDPGAGTPTGSVTFMEGSIVLGTGALSGHQAVFTLSTADSGTHSITAVYQGEAGFLGSTSTPVSQTVNPASTTTILVSSANPSVYGQAVTFTATVTPISPGAGTPTGTVTFTDGATTLGGLSISGQATFTSSALGVGSHTIRAVYTPDHNFATSTSAALSQTVSQASTTTGLTSSVNPSIYHQAVTFTATVAAVGPGAGTPSGTVTFRDGATVLGTRTLNAAGTASLSTASLRVGSHAITVVYNGDPRFKTSSAALTQSIRRAGTATTMASAPGSVVYGQAATFVASAASLSPGGGTPGGAVTFKDGMTVLGTGVLNANGVASFSATSLTVGRHFISAAYEGDGSFEPSSAVMGCTVAPAGTTISLDSSSSRSASRQAVTFTATVAAIVPGGGTPGGTVTFRDGSRVLGTRTLDGRGVATLTTSSLRAGQHVITVAYRGDAGYKGSTSVRLIQRVVRTAARGFVRSWLLPGTRNLVEASG